MPNIKYKSREGVEVNDTINDTINDTTSLTKTEIKILELLKKEPNITISAVTEIVSLTGRTVKRHIKRLKEKGYIKRIGANKNGYWVILKNKKH